MEQRSDRTQPVTTETLAQAQQAVIESFGLFESWAERYQHLVELGRQLPPFPADHKVESNRLHGCQAGVWLLADYRDDRLFFEATSDSAIVAGLIALLLKVYSGRRPDEVLAASPAFIDAIGLADHLSPHRANGLSLMLARVRSVAASCANDEGSSGSRQAL